MKNNIYKILVKFALKLHNFSYKLSSRFAIKAEGGLHPKHRLIGYHKFFINNINKGDAILDIGCGNGVLALDLSKKAKEVFAIDLNKKNISKAKEEYSAPNIRYIVGDAVVHNFNQKFDVVILSNVLEHIEDRVKFLNKVKSLAPKILIRVPMFDRDWITLYKKELGIEWCLDSTHFTEYILESFQEELKKAGLNLNKYKIQFGEIWAIVK